MGCTVLQSLHAQLKSKDKTLINKRVTTPLSMVQTQWRIQCADGTQFVGDIVVGANGIHSCVRQEMQRLLEEKNPGWWRGKKSADVESSSRARTVHISQDIDHLALLFVGKNSVPQWFFGSKMYQKYQEHSSPRFTKPQMEEQVNRYANSNSPKGWVSRIYWRRHKQWVIWPSRKWGTRIGSMKGSFARETRFIRWVPM
jgi:2-polyprenyl-6-methoxyphenol hydroxylase-like FAD-dependent oxidoreductase